MKVLGENRIGYTISENFAYTFKSYNPCLLEENQFYLNKVTIEDLEETVFKANQAFTTYSKLKGSTRALFLFRIAETLSENSDDLCSMFVLESGLPVARAQAELNRTILQLKTYADFINEEAWNFISLDLEDNERKPNPRPKITKYYKPLGPVVVFGASNFPFAYSTCGGDTASALAAGCPVIVKAHPFHAGTSDLVAQIILQAAEETNMPDGVFSHVFDDTFEAGEFLVQNEFIKAVGFTGSFKGGIAIEELIRKRKTPIPLFAEMGSVNPIFIFSSALESNPLIAEQIANSISLNAGQFCTNPGLVFYLKSELSLKFEQKLTELLKNIPSQVMLHPNIFSSYINQADKISEDKNVIDLLKSDDMLVNNFKPILRKVSFSVFQENENLQEEVFGSHTILVELEEINQFEQAIEILKGQLTISLYASDSELLEVGGFFNCCEQKAGRIIFNGVPTGVEVVDSMHHGGPFPATTSPFFTAVGKDAIYRFLRPISYQNFSNQLVSLFSN